jgi:hypothetical protein
MGLRFNSSFLSQNPIRYIGGSPGNLRQMWGRTELRNTTCGEGISDKTAGIPYGHLAPSSWCLPFKAGAMSSFTNCVFRFTPGDLTLAAGRNLSAATTVTVTVSDALLELIVSAVGSTSITFTLTGTALIAANAIGNTSFSFTVNNATLGAIIDAVANTFIQFSAAATPRATGNLEGHITPFTELSPQSLAAAVWQALSAEYNDAGTMGNKLNSAASAGDPWSTALPGSYSAGEAGYILGNQVLTEADIVRIADIVLRRATSNVEASSDGDALSVKSLYGMIAQGVHNTQVSGTTLTVTKSDDTTVLGTRTVTTDPTAEPIIGINSD